ncbi:SpoIIE family protein phosphatase [Streptomyces griseus]|uniref:ATP-binding SpoIIE family protein phosphatase n=1 Tax=Streptomyces griseus TaxID=1911 RepID=UPI000A457069|nr:SpoIIE family protein phosphatase [Streptomyces griseus]
MATNADACLSSAARGLKPRVEELVDALVERLRVEIPVLWEGEDTAPVVFTLSQHVTHWLGILEQGLDVREVSAPPVAIERARRFAQRGGQMSELLHGYRLGLAGILQWTLEEVVRVAKNPELISAAATKVSVMGFEFNDRIAKQVTAAYQEERERLLKWRQSVIDEATVRVGATLDLTRTCQELANVGTDHFADVVTVDLLDSVLEGEETDDAPGPSQQTLRRIAERAAPGGRPDSAVAPDETHTYPPDSEQVRTLAAGTPERGRVLNAHGALSVLMVPLWARGVTLGLVQFFRHGTPDPYNDDDLLLAQEIASRAAVYIDNARRYTHQRSTALALQRSLLPHHVPEQPAAETASRYLPCGAREGVGGDWYDVIPLSGARVALVVGDVIGRGLQAAATMGRLRTAVRTLADIDLPPDELLTHLDDVVIRLQGEQEPETDEISATCLYLVYDPVSRLCSVSSAGHVPPAVVTPAAAGGAPPARTVDVPELPIGPPLGLGGLPFETTQFELPEGSVLALYTDGLIEGRDRDAGTGIAQLRDVLARAPTSLEDTCDLLLTTLLTSRPSDDVALLLARTRALDADHVATWDLPSDPAIVSEARARACDQLAVWGLEDAAFTTELVVSELVTNAIRYGKPPIQLRMIHQTTLTCEVSDTGSTVPHMRRARTFDEGGRGLLLVAQLANHWGTRHTREGKVIWAEQPLSSM